VQNIRLGAAFSLQRRERRGDRGMGKGATAEGFPKSSDGDR
jgi:hypothetical protein